MRFLVTGAEGQLGHDLVDALSGSVPPGGLRAEAATGRLGERPACDVTATDYRVLDVCDRDAVLAAMEGIRPDVVVHAAAWTTVDACEADPDRAFTVNSLGTRNVAEAARRFAAHVVYVSSDYVFDGTCTRPYREWDQPCPVSVYGHSKLGGERNSIRGQRSCAPRGCAECTARTWSVPFCAWPRPVGHFDCRRPARLTDVHRRSRRGRLRTGDRAHARHLPCHEPGCHHMARPGSGRPGGIRGRSDAGGADPHGGLTPPRPAPRPANSVLDNATLRLAGMPLLPEWHDGLERLVAALSGTRDLSSAPEEER